MTALRLRMIAIAVAFVALLCPHFALAQPGEDDEEWLDEESPDDADNPEAGEDEQTDGETTEPTDQGETETGDDSPPDDESAGETEDEAADETDGDVEDVEGADVEDGASKLPTREQVIEYFEELDQEARKALLQELKEIEGDTVRSDTIFRAGVQALSEKRFEDAAVSFEIFMREFADDSRAGAAKQLELFAQQQLDGRGVSGELKDKDSDSTGGAIEYVTMSTVYGIWTGFAASIVFEVDAGYGVLISGLTGVGALGGSLAYAWDADISLGDSALISNATLFGGWNGVALTYAFGSGPNPEPAAETVFGLAWGLSTMGYAGALTASIFTDVDDGDVALANSGGIWGTFYAGMVILAFVEDVSTSEVMGGLVTGTDLGIAAMGVLAGFVDTSRGRMALIDLGGLLGGLLGFGILYAADDAPERGVAGVTMMLSAATGIGLAAWLTSPLDEDKDEDDDDDNGATTQLHTPTPFALPQRGTDGREGIAAGVNVLNMTW